MGSIPPPYGYQQQPQPQRPGTPVWAIVLMVFVVLGGICAVMGAAILFPVFRQARSAARSTVKLSETKQIVLAAIMYEADHKDKFPSTDNPSALAVELKPYLKSGPDLVSKLPNYRWNPKLAGRTDLELTNSPNVWYCETGPDELHYVYIGFADGHARKVKEELAATYDSTAPIFEKI